MDENKSPPDPPLNLSVFILAAPVLFLIVLYGGSKDPMLPPVVIVMIGILSFVFLGLILNAIKGYARFVFAGSEFLLAIGLAVSAMWDRIDLGEAYDGFGSAKSFAISLKIFGAAYALVKALDSVAQGFEAQEIKARALGDDEAAHRWSRRAANWRIISFKPKS